MAETHALIRNNTPSLVEALGKTRMQADMITSHLNHDFKTDLDTGHSFVRMVQNSKGFGINH